MKSFAKKSGNETLFKDSISLLDELDVIRVSNASEQKKVVEVFKKHGITTLPDGRRIENIIVLTGEVPK